uniref:MICOS complex subunit n=1 Tax=Periophthalmus magnuspinnatus TaxID=409849 RepID=A0A3B4AJL7_9GOBI
MNIYKPLQPSLQIQEDPEKPGAIENVYYYLKDPPPEFLPRFGTITMAGLLGMFLARKGSRLRRVALPMSLMTAGASVCYPSQAVAVLTGKKVYAAGQWSSATVSSLLSSPPKPPPCEHLSKLLLHLPSFSPEGTGFKAKPALMDFGQSNPEDADLYTTRS